MRSPRSRLAALLLLLAPLVSAQEPAALFPDGSFLYIELDAGAFERGLRQLDVNKILANPKFRDFFMPGFRRLRVDPEDPAGSLVKRLKVKEWLAGKAAFAVRGVSVAFDKRKRSTFTPKKPVTVSFLRELLGSLLAAILRDGDSAEVTVRLDLDLAAVVEPGPRLKGWMKMFLQDPPFELKRRAVQMGDRQLLHLSFPAMHLEDNFYYAPEVYLDLGKDRWLMATDPEVLSKMLAGGPRANLAASERFRSVRERMTGGHRALFGWLDAARALEIVKRFVPPIVAEFSEKSGLASLRGAGFGVSLTEGGVRESFGLVLDGNPRGVWRLLDAFPPGMRSIEIAPPDTAILAGAKFDLSILEARLREVAAGIAPGNGAEIERGLGRAFRIWGLEFARDVKPALGDEIGLIMFRPKAMMPEWVFGLDLRDTEAFGRMFPKLQKMLGWNWEQVAIDEQVRGWQAKWPFPAPPPWFAVHKGHLFGASEKGRLLEVLHKWGGEGSKTLARDSEVFRRTLRGLGGQKENLIALAYMNLRTGIPDILGMWPAPLPREFEGFVDLDRVPDPAKLFEQLAGVAVALRNDRHGIRLDTYSPVGLVWTGPYLMLLWLFAW